MEKFERVSSIISDSLGSDVKILDIGCRRKGLEPHVKHLGVYHGADLFQTGSVEYVGDFTKGLPIPDREYDAVVALDVVEHTEDMTAALDEIFRVTGKIAIVILPNHAHWLFRLNFLVNGRIGDKWDVDFPIGMDRHRWLTTAKSSDVFMRKYCENRGISLSIQDSKLGKLGPLVEKTLGRLFPNFWNKNQLYILRR